MEMDTFEVGKVYMMHTNRNGKYMPDWFDDRERYAKAVREGLDSGESDSYQNEYLIMAKKKAQAKVLKRTDKTVTFEVYDGYFHKTEKRLKIQNLLLEDGTLIECAFMEYKKYKGIFASVEFQF